MLPLLYLISGVTLCIILVKSTSAVINSTSNLARHLKISEYTISFLVIAVATSMPELIVGITSALDNNPSLSLGNVWGSNIADVTIIIALPVLLAGGVSTKALFKSNDMIFAAFTTVLPVLLILDSQISKFDGLILVLSYVIYLFEIARRSTGIEKILDSIYRTDVKKNIFVLVIALALMLTSARFIVTIAENLSLLINLPLIFIGLTVTAIGTSLPELVFGIKAVKTNHQGEVVGNIVGSVIANSTLVLGVTALIAPINSSGIIGGTSIIFLVITLSIFAFFSYSDRKLSKVEAIILCLTYIAFVLLEKYLLGK